MAAGEKGSKAGNDGVKLPAAKVFLGPACLSGRTHNTTCTRRRTYKSPSADRTGSAGRDAVAAVQHRRQDLGVFSSRCAHTHACVYS